MSTRSQTRYVTGLLFVFAISTAHAQSDPPGTTAARLKAGGVEPTEQGVKGFLESLIEPKGDDQIDKLIGQLGQGDFATREKATQQLTRSGLPIEEKLEAASKSSDPEIALRAKLILSGRGTVRESTLRSALQFIVERPFPVGLPLLLKIHAKAASDVEKDATVNAMVAIVADDDRDLIDVLLKDDNKDTRNVGRRLLARIEREPAAPLLEGVFDAVFVKPGTVAGGGPDLIHGWEFKARANMVVTHLGIYDDKSDGLEQPHEVAIWEVKNDKKPVVQETIPAGSKAALTGVFRFVKVPAARLEAGKHYAIVAHYDQSKDSAVSMDNPGDLIVKFADHVEVLGRRYTFPHKRMAYPSELSPKVENATLGPTMRYEVSEE